MVFINVTFSAVAVVDLENVTYQVTEGGLVQICAVVRTPNISCPVDFSYDLNLSVGDGMRMKLKLMMVLFGHSCRIYPPTVIFV